MNRYRKPITIFIAVLIIGAVGLILYLTQQDQAKKITSFSELYNKHFEAKEITSLLLDEYSFVTPAHDHHLFVKDKEKIEKVINLLSQMEWKYEASSRLNSEKAAYQISLSHEHDLIFAIIISDNGHVETFDYATNKSHSYRITNDFDVDAIERLFEIESD